MSSEYSSTASEASPETFAGAWDAFRSALDAATRRSEPECVRALVPEGRFSAEQQVRIHALATRLATGVRLDLSRAGGGINALMSEFSLDSGEGVALMSLAEALLRVPDEAGRSALLRDKLCDKDWSGHLGCSPSLLVNGAAWSLALTGSLLASGETGDHGVLHGLLSRGGTALARQGVEFAIRHLGRQFVLGETIAEALAQAGSAAGAGYLYSFDMLGEAAMSAEAAEAYCGAYTQAIRAIGAADRQRGVVSGNGLSVKLSALHPRYAWSQRGRVVAELLPRVRHLCRLARDADISLTIDAEESDRLALSLDILAALMIDPELAGWSGLGVAVQAYQKRAPVVIDGLIALARMRQRRLMVRLVKGAYWDGEIKRCQQDGLEDYPVFTRKAHTDLAYLVCARRLLAARDAVFPLFATHNAHTVAAVIELGGPFQRGDYEFQCLHGMGGSLYRQLISAEAGGLQRPVRVYAPVGNHQTLLAYLVRRLLENGANTSFVNRIMDERLSISTLLDDPAYRAAADEGLPHPQVPLPPALHADRRNSRGQDLASDRVRQGFLAALAASRQAGLRAEPRLTCRAEGTESAEWRDVCNPASTAERIGFVRFATSSEVAAALAAAQAAAPVWAGTPPLQRALALERMGEALEDACHAFVALLVREAGKTIPAALGEVREAVDFCRYYAASLRSDPLPGAEALGPVVAISPWNFPLAIFVGQIAAALAAGNPVIAKPAEQTPLVADQAVALFHAAGIPPDVLQCLPGPGETGAALVADRRVQGVLFTGSTAVARQIHRCLAGRGDIPLVAETGGINAMIADSTALPEQVVADALLSAFDSAGQRCSALRLLCVHEEIAERVVTLLDGAMAELCVGAGECFETDLGPLIDGDARLRIEAWIEAQRANRRKVLRRSLPQACQAGHFVAPTLVMIDSPADLQQEVFGPVLHVLSYREAGLDRLMDEILANGYGLTFGIQSRVDARIEHLLARARMGNRYVNRSMIGAVVGAQPFGGEGLSGTGPKAGGPLTLRRLVRTKSRPLPELPRPHRPVLDHLEAWLAGCAIEGMGEGAGGRLRHAIETYRAYSLEGLVVPLPGVTGESNRLSFHPRGDVLALADGPEAWLHQFAAALASGNRLVVPEGPPVPGWLATLPPVLRAFVERCGDPLSAEVQGVLVDGPDPLFWRRAFAEHKAVILPVLVPAPLYCLERLVVERCVSVNTAATGGNAGLLGLADV